MSNPTYDNFPRRARVVVTSGAYGHTTETNIAMGYVDPDHAAPGTSLEVSIIGTSSPAIVAAEAAFDPAHERPRADQS